MALIVVDPLEGEIGREARQLGCFFPVLQCDDATALGAENTVRWEHAPDAGGVVDRLRADGYEIAAVETLLLKSAGEVLEDLREPVLVSRPRGCDFRLHNISWPVVRWS